LNQRPALRNHIPWESDTAHGRVSGFDGWYKTIGPVAKTMLRGVERVGAQFTFTLAAYNLVRLPKLLAL